VIPAVITNVRLLLRFKSHRIQTPAAQLDLKTELYFANGSSEVWVVYPKTRKVLVHRADRNIQTVSAGELCSD
jgi:hypothetical protein